MKVLRSLLALALIFASSGVFAKILHVGKGRPYANINLAAKAAVPGDTILIHDGTYAGGQTLDNLQGTAVKWITIRAENSGGTIIEGGSSALMGSDLAYVRIQLLVFTKQVDNGVNFSDGGSYETPTHHIELTDCTFRDIAAKGNKDLLKISGVDEFTIERCTFINGAAGGSGIDMVGCHKGIISQCRFQNLGANAVQMKGGSSEITIQANIFKDAGERAINLGGSTGLPFFRPLNATWEASDLKVYCNVFIGSESAVAFVGSTRCQVINNTIYKPGKWVMRVLQENRDTVRFGKCSNNVFSNNVVNTDDKVRTVCNVGPNTAPATFKFDNNAWYNIDNRTWPGPQLPAVEQNAIINKDPLFTNAAMADFSISSNSPLAGAGAASKYPEKDHAGKQFKQKRSIGAFEVK